MAETLPNPMLLGRPQQFNPRADTNFISNVRSPYESLGDKALLWAREFNASESFSLGYRIDPEFDIESQRNPANSHLIDAIIADEREVYNVDHFNDIMQLMNDEASRAEAFHLSTGGTIAGSMIVDPANLVPTFGILGKGSAVARIGNATLLNFATEAPNMLLSYTENPLYNEEALLQNIGYVGMASLVFGGVLDRAGAIASDAINGTYRNFRNLHTDILVMEDLQRHVGEWADWKSSERGFDLSTEELDIKTQSVSQRVNGLIRRLQEITKVVDDPNTPLRDFGPASDRQQATRINLENAQTELASLIQERRMRLIDEATVDGVFDPWAIVGNMNPIPSPFTRILRHVPESGLGRSGLDMLKRTTLMVAGDYATITKGALAGVPMPESVLINSFVERRRWASVRQTAASLYSDLYNADAGITNVGAAIGKRPTLTQFMNEAYWDRALGRQPRSPQHASLIQQFDDFYKGFELEMRQYGVIGDLKRITRDIGIIEERTSSLKDALDRTQDPEKVSQMIDKMTDLERQLDQLRDLQTQYNTLDFKPAGKDEPYVFHNWDREVVRSNEEAFKNMLRNNFKNGGYYFTYDNASKRFVRNDYSAATAQEIEDLVNNTFENMLGDRQLNDRNMSMLDTLKYAHRQLQISNAEAAPFLVQDAMRNLQSYTEVSAAKIHFAKLFDGRSPKEVWDDIEYQLIVDGYSTDQINAFRRDYIVNEQRVIGGHVLADPTRWDSRTANFLRNFSALNYLTSSGLPGIADFARIIQEHKLNNIFSGLFKSFFDEDFRKLMRQTQSEFGDALELLQGSFAHNIAEGMDRQVGVNDAMGRAMNVNHILNGLGPVTTFLKKFDGALRQHTLIEYMENLTKGTASQFEINYLNRHGLSVAAARDIIALAPYEKSGSFTLANIDGWLEAGVRPEHIQQFRTAMNAGTSNTIPMATPADRPILANGVMFVKQSTIRNAPFLRNLPEDELVKGYVRLESGLMTLPFMFQSYMMAAMNKVTGAYVTGAIRNRYAGIAASMALGYMILAVRTPDHVWEQMDMKDRLARAFDYGGVAPLYTMLAYDHMSLARSLGTPSPFENVFSPKFPQEENIADAVTTITGPATSSIVDAARGVGNLMSGDFQEARRDFLNLAPLWDTMTVQFISDALTAPLQ